MCLCVCERVRGVGKSILASISVCVCVSERVKKSERNRKEYSREGNKNRVPILMVVTGEMYPDNSNLDYHLRMPIYFPSASGGGV